MIVYLFWALLMKSITQGLHVTWLTPEFQPRAQCVYFCDMQTWFMLLRRVYCSTSAFEVSLLHWILILNAANAWKESKLSYSLP